MQAKENSKKEPPQYPFKSEKIFALEGRPEAESINAMRGGASRGGGTAAGKVCFYCRESGHFIAECPRQKTGMPPSVVAAMQTVEAYEPVLAEDINYIRHRRMGTGSGQQVQQHRTHYQPLVSRGAGRGARGGQGGRWVVRGDRNRLRTDRRHNPRVAFMYDDDNGETVCCEMSFADGDERGENPGIIAAVRALESGVAAIPGSNPIDGVAQEVDDEPDHFLAHS